MRRYEAGESARAIVTETGVAPSALLRDRRVVVRPQAVTFDQEEKMAQEYRVGMTMAELEVEHGLSHGTVLRALHRARVEMRAKVPRRKSV